MPYRLPTACAAPGCPAVTTQRYCPRHAHLAARAAKRYERQRGTAAQRGYGAKWRRYRAEYLRQHPWCACGCGRPATDVDHIKPVTGPDDPLFWDPGNHQPLAHECHSRKTARQSSGWGARQG